MREASRLAWFRLLVHEVRTLRRPQMLNRMLPGCTILLLGVAAIGCGKSDRELTAVKADLDSLKVQVQALEGFEFKKFYQTIDVGHDGKVVGFLNSNRDIRVGERVFLGEDMY